jgi:hypothetical protein
MNFRVGDRVRYTSEWPCAPRPERTGLSQQIILEQGKEGEVVGFESGHPVVLWDAGSYRVFGGHAAGTGPGFLDRGGLDCPAFMCGLNAENVSALSPKAANRSSSPEDEQRARERAGFARRQQMIDFLTLDFCGPWGLQDYSAAEHVQIAELVIDHWAASDEEIARHLTAAGFKMDGRAKYITRVKQIGDTKYRELLGAQLSDASPRRNDPAAARRSITFTCVCGHRLKASPELAGKRAKCPKCGQVVVVPSHAAQTQSPADTPSTKPPKQAFPVAIVVSAKCTVGLLVIGLVIYWAVSTMRGNLDSLRSTYAPQSRMDVHWMDRMEYTDAKTGAKQITTLIDALKKQGEDVSATDVFMWIPQMETIHDDNAKQSIDTKFDQLLKRIENTPKEEIDGWYQLLQTVSGIDVKRGTTVLYLAMTDGAWKNTEFDASRSKQMQARLPQVSHELVEEWAEVENLHRPLTLLWILQSDSLFDNEVFEETSARQIIDTLKAGLKPEKVTERDAPND